MTLSRAAPNYSMPGFLQRSYRIYIPQNKVTVFNRWGKEIYSKINYDNTWDGKGDDDKPMPDDTYFYVIEMGEKTFNGYIMINR